jgi:hypothetical protein
MNFVDFLNHHDCGLITVNAANICAMEPGLTTGTKLHMAGGSTLLLYGDLEYIRHRLEYGCFPGPCQHCQPYDQMSCTDPRHLVQ